MPGKAAKVTVTERQHEILLTLRNATTAPAHLRQRATVILLAFDTACATKRSPIRWVWDDSKSDGGDAVGPGPGPA